MALLGRHKEQLQAWRLTAQTELGRLQSLTVPQLGAEIMLRGFGERDAADPTGQTQVSIAVLLCPDPPVVPKGADRELMEEFGPLASEGLGALESALLLRQSQGKTSDLIFYSPTERGTDALGAGEVESVLEQASTN